MIQSKTLKQLRKELDGRKIGARELTLEYLKRAKSDTHNAFITITEEEALKNADTAEKMIASGTAEALTGIPCSIKDNVFAAGIKTTCGSRILGNFVPSHDAKLIRDLKSQGYVLTGKTNMDEFAMGNSNRTSAFGNVLNPADNRCVSGGSSGGSAVSVAAGLCAYSFGTDTGGSVRQPAAYCGVVGLKPTYGTISRHGIVEFAASLDTVGPIAKTAEDCAVIMDALCGAGGDGTQGGFGVKIGRDIKGVKIALIKELFTDSVDMNVRAAINETIRFLTEQGAEITEVSMPVLAYAASAYFALSSAEGANALSAFKGADAQTGYDSRARGFGNEVKRRVMLGNFMLSGENADYLKKAHAVKQRIAREYDAIFGKADVVISPTSSRTAFHADEPTDLVKTYSSTLYTVPANLSGNPSVSVPCHKSGMPVGLSVTGKHFDEATILQIADCVDKWRNQ